MAEGGSSAADRRAIWLDRCRSGLLPPPRALEDCQMNLITDAWLPVRTPAGRQTIQPDQIADPDVLALDFPRPDLNGAVAELLIALLATFDPPADEREWSARWQSRKIDAGALAVAASAFEFQRFAQVPDLT